MWRGSVSWWAWCVPTGWAVEPSVVSGCGMATGWADVPSLWNWATGGADAPSFASDWTFPCWRVLDGMGHGKGGVVPSDRALPCWRDLGGVGIGKGGADLRNCSGALLEV